MEASVPVLSHNRIDPLRRGEKLGILDGVFLLFCLMPFIFPNPIIDTDIQPYAAVLGTLVVLRNLAGNHLNLVTGARVTAVIGFMTLIVSCIVLIAVGVSLNSLRGVYNYYAVAVIPCAAAIVVEKLGRFPERYIKFLILVWFFVGTVQFFVSRTFAAGIIAGARGTSDSRGVIGLAAEPSFFGIACFYFLHMIHRFNRQRILFVFITLTMGVLYAQSAMGLLFIVGFLVVWLLENTHGRMGRNLWIGVGVALVLFFILLNTVLKETRLYDLYNSFINGGMDEVLSEDVSAETRAMSIGKAFEEMKEGYFMPLGFDRRIGSGYGGFLRELGFLAIPVLISISTAMARTFKRPLCRVVYFVVVTILLFNNTQIGNPLLLFVVGINSAHFGDKLSVPEGSERSEPEEEGERL